MQDCEVPDYLCKLASGEQFIKYPISKPEKWEEMYISTLDNPFLRHTNDSPRFMRKYYKQCHKDLRYPYFMLATQIWQDVKRRKALEAESSRKGYHRAQISTRIEVNQTLSDDLQNHAGYSTPLEDSEL